MSAASPLLLLTTVTATLRPTTRWRIPPRPEVMVRSSLGARLFDLCCRRTDQDCAPCPHQQDCPIPQWWDPARRGSHDVRPFVPAVPAGRGTPVGPDRTWELRLTLVTPPPDPELVIAMLDLAARRGLGPERVVHRLDRVQVSGATTEVVWDGARTSAAWPAPGPPPTLPVDPERLVGARVTLRTPWRWSPPPGKRATDRPTPADLVRAAWQRLRPVQRIQDGPLERQRWPDPAGLPGTWASHRYERVRVRSQRQAYDIDLSGHRGRLVFGPEIRPWARLLAAVAPINIGRQSSYGLGRIEAEWVAR